MIRKGGNPIPVATSLRGVRAPRTGAATTRGAFGVARASRTWRDGFFAESQREAVRISNEKSLRQAYAKFYATAEGRAFAKAHGASVDSRAYRSDRKNNLEFADPADLPDSVGCGKLNGRKIVRAGAHPIDHIEPASTHVQIDGLNEKQIRETSELFGDALRWGLDDTDLVARGCRTQVLIAAMRPDLAAGWVLDAALKFDFVSQSEIGNQHSEITAAGKVFGPYLEWMRRGPTISGFGERLDMTAYMLRPDLLPVSTLAKLGEILNKSRQAKNKLAGCGRDTFAGIKAPAMRPEITRDRCRASQLANL